MTALQPAESTAHSSGSTHNWPRISEYAAIGDCRSAALISAEGAVEWLCWPRFDSPSVFAAILDRTCGGSWRISPSASESSTRHRSYINESNVLRTTFEGGTGTIQLTDLMPVSSERGPRSILYPDHELLRCVDCTSGEVEVELYFQPRPDYARATPRFQKRGELGISFEAGYGIFYFRSSVPVEIDGDIIHARWRMRSGDSAQFSLSYGEESPVVLPPLGDWTHKRIEESTLMWCKWSAKASYDGPHRDAIVRSALALKLLSYTPSGAVVAALTTSLPERLGGELNWDYRFCWLRDASLTARALLGLGYYEEADAFIGWLLYATRLSQPQLRVMYTVFGNQVPHEFTLNHLSGYSNSRPVRVGNAARHQLQMDVYGEVLDAVAQYAFHRGPFARSTQKLLVKIGQYVAGNWDRPDQGIWEPRQQPQAHTHSRVLCWTALDRLITMAEKGHLDRVAVPLNDFCRERDRIAEQVKTRAWNPALNSYVSAYGTESLDASLLLMSYYGFEAAGSDRMRATYSAIRNSLSANGGLLYRYREGPAEGAFGICSFWEAEYLALGGGTAEDALKLFEQLLQYQNDVGLYAEEVDPKTGEPLGNFPQAFTHIGLISAALSITERLKGAKQLPHREPSAEENKAA